MIQVLYLTYHSTKWYTVHSLNTHVSASFVIYQVSIASVLQKTHCSMILYFNMHPLVHLFIEMAIPFKYWLQNVTRSFNWMSCPSIGIAAEPNLNSPVRRALTNIRQQWIYIGDNKCGSFICMKTSKMLLFSQSFISVGKCKEDVTPLLTHWIYVFLALTHRFFCKILIKNNP